MSERRKVREEKLRGRIQRHKVATTQLLNNIKEKLIIRLIEEIQLMLEVLLLGTLYY